MKPSHWIAIPLLLLAGCDFLTTPGRETVPVARRKILAKKDIAGCWHEVANPRFETSIYPVTDAFCFDLCFSLATDRFEQAVYTRETISYKKRYDVLGLKWTETTRTNQLKAYGTYSLKADTLRRKFEFPDPPTPDTSGIWRPVTALARRGDTLEVAGHLYIRPDSSRHCGNLWTSFDPDPDPPDGGGGGGIDWD